jgi:hypothetical protein
LIKGNIVAHGKGPGTEGLAGLNRLGIGVDADIAEVIAHAGLKEGLFISRQGLPPASHLVDVGLNLRRHFKGAVATLV